MIGSCLWSIRGQTHDWRHHQLFMRIKFDSLLFKTDRFHVASRLFIKRSHKTSKCGKNMSDSNLELRLSLFSSLVDDKSTTREEKRESLGSRLQWHTRLSPRVPFFCSYHILTSSVIDHWTWNLIVKEILSENSRVPCPPYPVNLGHYMVLWHDVNLGII